MDKENISKEERRLCREIYDTGIEKCRRETRKLADLVQVKGDVTETYNREFRQKLYKICEWLDGARRTRAAQCEAAGVSVTLLDSYGQYRELRVKDGDETYLLDWEGLDSGGELELPRLPYPPSDSCTADSMMNSITSCLMGLRRLQSIVIKYMKLKNEIDDLEHEESLNRVAKFRHQLELLKKL